MTTSPKPSFATNRPGERVADAVDAHLEHLRGWNKDFEGRDRHGLFQPRRVRPVG